MTYLFYISRKQFYMSKKVSEQLDENLNKYCNVFKASYNLYLTFWQEENILARYYATLVTAHHVLKLHLLCVGVEQWLKKFPVLVWIRVQMMPVVLNDVQKYVYLIMFTKLLLKNNNFFITHNNNSILPCKSISVEIKCKNHQFYWSAN